MDISEAKQIFDVWCKWVWPCHSMLFAIFRGGIPESFLPYPEDVLNEALTIMANYYYKCGNKEIAEAIIGARDYVVSFYTKDEESVEMLKKELLEIPGTQEALLESISRYKKDWEDWLSRRKTHG